MQSINSTLQFSAIPETQVFKFIEIHTKDAAKIKANEEKESAFFNALKGSIVKVGKLLNLKKENDDIEVSYIDCFYKSYWCIDAQRLTQYECDAEYPIVISNLNAKEIRIMLEDYTASYMVENNQTKLRITEVCERKNDYYNVVDNETAEIDNDFHKNYIENPNYRKRKFNIDSDKILKPKMSKTGLIQRVNENLSTAIKADRILNDQIYYNKIELYLVPIYFFECYKKSTKEKALIKINALTGKVIRDNNLRDVMSNEEVKTMLIDIAAEIASASVPGLGVAIKASSKIIGNVNEK